MCPKAEPFVAPHLLQVCGSVHVAVLYVCPKADPFVAPHLLQVCGSVHVAVLYVCEQEVLFVELLLLSHATKLKHKMAQSKIDNVFFIDNPPINLIK